MGFWDAVRVLAPPRAPMRLVHKKADTKRAPGVCRGLRVLGRGKAGAESLNQLT